MFEPGLHCNSGYYLFLIVRMMNSGGEVAHCDRGKNR